VPFNREKNLSHSSFREPLAENLSRDFRIPAKTCSDVLLARFPELPTANPHGAHLGDTGAHQTHNPTGTYFFDFEQFNQTSRDLFSLRAFPLFITSPNPRLGAPQGKRSLKLEATHVHGNHASLIASKPAPVNQSAGYAWSGITTPTAFTRVETAFQVVSNHLSALFSSACRNPTGTVINCCNF